MQEKKLKNAPTILAIKFNSDKQPERIPLSDDINPDSSILSVLSSIEYIGENGYRLIDLSNYLVWIRDQNGETVADIEENQLGTRSIGEFLYLIEPEEEFETDERFSQPHYCLDLVINPRTI